MDVFTYSNRFRETVNLPNKWKNNQNNEFLKKTIIFVCGFMEKIAIDFVCLNNFQMIVFA